MKRSAQACLLVMALAVPQLLLAQDQGGGFVALDSFPMPVNPGEIPELTDRGLLSVRVPRSDQIVQVREAEAGQAVEVTRYWLFVDEQGRLLDARPDSDDGDESLRKTVEEALPRMEYRPGFYRERPVEAWVLLEFVFLEEGQEPVWDPWME